MSDNTRYLLQSAAHHDVNMLPDEYIEMLNETLQLCKRSSIMKENIRVILSDLSLLSTNASPGSVLSIIQKSIIPLDDLSSTKILYFNGIYPEIISRGNNSSAIVYVNTNIFPGFSIEDYKYLKYDLKIEYVKIIYRNDDEEETIISDNYELISKYFIDGEFTFDITERSVAFICIAIIIFIIFINSKMIKKI